MIDVPVSTLVELALKSTLLPAVAFLLVSGLARRPAAERHFVWSAVIVGLLAVPFLSLLPGFNVLPRFDAFAAPARTVSLPDARSDSPAPADAGRARRAPAIATPSVSATSAQALRAGERPPSMRSGAPDTARRFALGNVLSIGYASVAALLLARLVAAVAGAWASVGRLAAVSDPASARFLEDGRSRLGIRRTVRLLESPSEQTPWAFGLFRPVIVVPAGFPDWPETARRNALMHELAHVARFDHATAVLSRACAAFYWIQPLVWLAGRRLALEAERACDDQVLLAGASRADYAAQLLAVASRMRRARTRVLHGTAMAASPAVAVRLSAILDADTRRTAMTKPKAACLAVLAAAALAPLAVVKSQAPAEDAAAPPADFGHPTLAPLASRDPVNSDELGGGVRAYLARGLDEQASALIAQYLRDRASPLPGETVSVEPPSSCAYCVSLVGQYGPLEPNGQTGALLAALETLEREARAAGDGNLLVKLAVVFADVDAFSAHGLSLSFLLEAIPLGNLNAEMKLAAADLLGRRGWYEPAKALALQVRNDPASSVAPDTIQAWLDYFEGEVTRQAELKARLVSNDGDGPSEYIPIYKVAPYYPAAAAGAEGSVIVQFTVTEQGRTKDLEIIESSNPVFDEPATWAAKQFRYAPRIVDGEPVAVPGVRNRITFQLQSH